MLLVLLIFITFSIFAVFSYKIKIANIMAMYFLGCVVIMFSGMQYFLSLSSHQLAGTVDYYILLALKYFRMNMDNAAYLHNIGIIILMGTSVWCANLAKPLKWWVNVLLVLPILLVFYIISPTYKWEMFLKIASLPTQSAVFVAETLEIGAIIVFFGYLILPLVFFGVYIGRTKIFLKRKFGITCLICVSAMYMIIYMLFINGIFTPTMFYNIDMTGFPTSYLGIYSENAAIIISVFCMIFINVYIVLYFKPFEKYGRWRKKKFLKRSREVSENLHMQLHMYKNTFLCIEKYTHMAEEAADEGSIREIKSALKRIKSEVCTSVEDISRTLKMLNNVIMDYHVFTIDSCLTEAVSKAVPNDVNVTYSIPKSNTVVLGNKAHIVESFVNILRNATEAMQNNSANRKRIEISVYTEEDMLLATVKDYGCGISKKNMKKIFKLFFTTKEQKIGTGLGLDYAKRVMTIHGGGIEVESSEGYYTNVYVALPIYNHR